MAKIDILKKLSNALEPTTPDFSKLGKEAAVVMRDLFSEKFARIKERLEKELEKKIKVKILDEVNGQLEKFKTALNLPALVEAMESFEQETSGKFDILESRLEKSEITGASSLENALKQAQQKTESSIHALNQSIGSLSAGQKTSFSTAKTEIGKLQNYFNGKVSQITSDIEKLKTKNDDKKEIQKLEDALEETRKELLNRINNIPKGGNANRLIMLNANASTLGKYTDINFQNSSSIGWTHTVDDTNRRVNIMASILQGGGGAVTWTSATPSGSINGTNTVFTLPATPTAGSLFVFLNGAFQANGGEDYTLSGSTITFVNAPLTNSILRVKYTT